VRSSETPHRGLQWRAAISGDGAPTPMNEEGGEGKEVVREHRRHTARTAEGLVRTGRACVVLATCAVKGTSARRAGKAAPRRHRSGPRPNPRAHGEGEVKVSSDYEPIEQKKQRRGSPPNLPCSGGEQTGGRGKTEIAGNTA
jgi:hypothetical protein